MGNTRSKEFRIFNGTNQGAVISSFFWNLHLDDLLKELQASGVGCYIAGFFMGATAYADDLFLLCPTKVGWQEC